MYLFTDTHSLQATAVPPSFSSRFGMSGFYVRVCKCSSACVYVFAGLFMNPVLYKSSVCVCVCASASLCASALCEKWCENASRGACVSSASNMREICGTYLRYDTSQNDMTHPCYIWLIKLQPAKCVSKQQTITKARFDWRHVASYYYH